MSRHREGSYNRRIEQRDAKFSRHKFIETRAFRSTKELLEELHAFCSDQIFDQIVETYGFNDEGLSKRGHDVRDLLFEFYFKRIRNYCDTNTARNAKGERNWSQYSMLDNPVYYEKPMNPSTLSDADAMAVLEHWDIANVQLDAMDAKQSNFPDILGNDVE